MEDGRIAVLLREAAGLTPERDSARLGELYSEAAALWDKAAEPKKWAALRCMYGKVILATDPLAALSAFREALPCFDAVRDREFWADCKSSIGWCLVNSGQVWQQSEEIIECLEATIAEYPDLAHLLASYYAARVIGDPLENWKKQVHYLELARRQPAALADPLAWSEITDSLASAMTEEPDGDFEKAVEKRIALSWQARARLEPLARPNGSKAQRLWIMNRVNLSEAYLTRVAGDANENRVTAEQFAREAYGACGPLLPGPQPMARVFAALALAKTLLESADGKISKDRCLEALKLAIDASSWIDAAEHPVEAATSFKFVAMARLKLLELGEADQLAKLLEAADKAYALLDPVSYADLQRVVMQIASDGLLAENQYARAVGYLQRAVDAGERQLERATTPAGRLEAIFNLHDSSARLGYCYLRAGDIGQGIAAIDAGKGRLWRTEKPSITLEQVKALVPQKGALLFPVFAPKDGAIAVVSEQGERVCLLAGVGREHLTRLLVEDVMNPESESWLARYTFRGRDLARWKQTIDAMGGRLHELFWVPLLQDTFHALGVEKGAEIVWFPQAGLGGLPLHAAWRMEGSEKIWIGDEYAIRFAPSASCLSGLKQEGEPRSTLVVADSLGNLPNSALELFWMKEANGAAELDVLLGAEATKSRVVSGLKQARRAHFATHAEFRVDDPFQSRLALANNEFLTLGELVPLLKQSGLREVVLSCCETAVTQVWRRPDELLGFPTALLQHGIETVIATQWPVEDWAAAALMGRFYREWKTVSAAEAMRRAQRWMRQVTADELLDLLRPLVQEAQPVKGLALKIRQSLQGMEPAARPLADAYNWAPFIVSGI